VGNAVGEIGDGPCHVALVGHIDTVPGTIPVRVEDGVLHGRGAVDAKGPLVAFVVAAARAASSGLLRLSVVGCVEEEAPSSKGARHLARGTAPDFLVVGEPSAWDGVTLGYKGYLRARLVLEGEGAHTAHDTLTLPARACTLWQRIEAAAAEYAPTDAPAFDRLLAALIDVRCENDGLSTRAALDLSLRLPLELGPELAEDWLRNHAPEAEMQLLAPPVPAWSGPRTSSLARAFGRSILERGGRPRFQRKTGTADLNLLAPAFGCPALAYGPGDAALDHSPRERVEIEEVLRAIQVLEGALLACGAAISVASLGTARD
ncbi:MAG: M20/M25/M40 family metallo-hydrolase, partial [Planctomycetota bacterium]